MARRQSNVLDDLFEILSWVFSVVHPAWSLLVAVVLFFVPVIWFRSTTIPAVQMLGCMLGALLAIVSLVAGMPEWKMRRQRAAFLQQHLDIGWLNKLGWQDFERQVAEVYRQRGYQGDEVGGGGFFIWHTNDETAFGLAKA